ncbi:MAG: hypothetical protein U0872_00810 [Planctomycetaceae bacterium]
MQNLGRIALIGMSCLLAASSAQAQWGTLKGKIVLDGDVPEQKLTVRKGDSAVKDAAICAAQDIPDEAIVIDKDSKGIANVAIWLVKKPAKIHPDLEKPAEPTVLFDQVGCRFIPHILVVRAGQTVKVVSGDATAHNTRGLPSKNNPFNFTVAPNDRAGNDVPFKLAERLPVPVNCDIHSWMRAYWVVVDHPYAAVTDKDGNFEIKDLPAGDHEFRVWQENVGYLVKDTKDPKKGPTFSIKAGGTTEVPVIKVKLEQLQGDSKKTKA